MPCAVVHPIQKTCIRCGQSKDLSEFHRNSQHKDGLQGECRPCAILRVTEERTRNPDRRRASHLKRIQVDFNNLWAQQGGLCAVCGTSMLPRGKFSDSVCVDHDRSCCPTELGNSCGKCVRGLIHQRCNFLLGKARDDLAVLRGALQYLERWQTTRKGAK